MKKIQNFLTFFIWTIHSWSTALASQNEQPSETLAVASDRGIFEIDTNTRTPKQIVIAPRIGAFDYHPEKRVYYYNDLGEKVIYSVDAAKKGSEPKLVIKHNQNWYPISIAVDYLSNNIYVLDHEALKVDVYDLEGKSHGVALAFGLDYPTDLVIDPYRGYMFIANFDKITRCNLDGTSCRNLYNESVGYSPMDPLVQGLTIDVNAMKIHFANKKIGLVVSIDYDGNQVKVYSTAVKVLPKDNFSLDILEDQFYVYTKNNKLQDSEKVKVFYSRLIGDGNHVKLISKPKIFPKLASPCSQSNGNCQQFCSVKNGTSKCDCKVGYTLASNNKSCKRIDEFLLLPLPWVVKSYNLNDNSDGMEQAIAPIVLDPLMFYEVAGIDCDARGKTIYYATKGYYCLFQARTIDSKSEKIMCIDDPRETGPINSLALDWTSGNIYFTSYYYLDKGYLQVINPKSSSKPKVLLENLYKPESVVVHPDKGYVYLAEKNESHSILRVNFDGKDLKRFESPEISHIEQLAIDYQDDRIYWSDTGFHEGIKSMDLNGQDIKVFSLKYTESPTALDVYKNDIFVIVGGGPRLFRFDKNTGKLVKDFGVQVPVNGDARIKICSKEVQKLSGDVKKN